MIDKQISHIILTEDDEFSVYRNGSFLNDTGKFKNISSIILYNKVINQYENEMFDFNNIIEENDVANIYNLINYLQKYVNEDRNTYPRIIVEPYKYYNFEQFYILNDKGNIVENLEIEFITKQIDDNEPVIIFLTNTLDGHTVLGYRYEYINDNIVKIYISDSNIMLQSKEKYKDIENKIEKYNHDVEQIYMLFYRENSNDKWSYIYNPTVNDNRVYFEEYNSYVLGTYLTILYPIMK